MHIPELERALSELARVLRKGGIMVLNENNMEAWDVKIRERLISIVKTLLGRNSDQVTVTPRGIEVLEERRQRRPNDEEDEHDVSVHLPGVLRFAGDHENAKSVHRSLYEHAVPVSETSRLFAEHLLPKTKHPTIEIDGQYYLLQEVSAYAAFSNYIGSLSFDAGARSC
jgi:hypothetical protein